MLQFLHQSLLICYLITGLFKPTSVATPENLERHPLHLSSTELNYNAASSTIEVSCRIFTDDFEALLGRKYKVKADLSAAAKHKEMDALIAKYMAANLQLKGNGKALRLNYLGFENDKEAVIVYLESDQVKGLKNLETYCSLLYDLFDDQNNIFHVTVNGNRKSAKLDFPDKKLVSTF